MHYHHPKKKSILTPLCFYYYYSCPFDAVTIYDGPDNMAEKIGTYCGQMRNLVIFSTQNKLYITFTTLKRTAPAQNRGFFAIYEFSESFVKLGKYRFFFEFLFVVGAKKCFSVKSISRKIS